MSSYTIVNLMDVEGSDMAAEQGIEMRFGRKHLDSEHLGVTYVRYAPNLRPSMGHSHRQQEEAYVVVEGSGRVRLDDEIRDVRRWDVIRVAPEVVRAFEAGPEGLVIIAVGGPKPEGGDGVAADTPWPDEPQR